MTKKTITITMNNKQYEVPTDIAQIVASALVDYEVVAQLSPIDQLKALGEAKKPAQQTSKSKAQPKADDDFDRAKYEATAKQLGCFGKRGVWKCCRPTVYKVMDGSLSLAKAKAEVKKIATEKGWELSK